jgi:DNA polymerase-1
MFLELNGITIDRPYLNQLRGEFLLRLEGIEGTLDEIIEGHINPRSPKQVKEYLLSQGVTVGATDKETLGKLLEILYRKGHHDSNVAKFVTTLLEHRRQQKLFSTYVEGMRRRLHNGRLHTTYTLHGTTSGRLASRNPNLQNVVRNKPIRRQFTVSKEGNVLIHGDYKQAEGRVITTLAQDEYLRGVFSNPEIDMFDELSNQLYGEGNWGKEERVRTKAFFYGIGYGREPYSIGLEYGMTPREAERRYKEFMDLIPSVARWQSNIRRQVLNGQDLITPFGRKRRFWLITQDNQKAILNEALSYLPQSTASDICLSALIDLRPMLRGRGFLRLTIHDALIAECSRERSEEVASLMASVMEEKGRLFTDYVPFPVDVSIGTSWDQL